MIAPALLPSVAVEWAEPVPLPARPLNDGITAAVQRLMDIMDLAGPIPSKPYQATALPAPVMPSVAMTYFNPYAWGGM